MTAAAFRDRYMSESVTTASPQRLLLMLYDRLCLDLRLAETALHEKDHPAGDRHLRHAQDILFELQGSLDLTAWPQGSDLFRVYGFLVTELAMANVQHDVARVTACRSIVEPLADAWHEAATQLQS